MGKRQKKVLATLLTMALALAMVPAAAFAKGAPAGEEGGLLRTMAAGDIPIDKAHFPDANFRAWLLNSGNINGAGSDGVLTSKEIAGITRIDARYKSISDLTGIKHFTALTYLDCYSNKLASLNVSGLASLSILNCSSNQLTSLTISGLTSLIRLDCYGNKLASLNVSKLASLKTLNCYNNQLSSLNVSGLSSLEILNCYNNQLSSLNVSGLASLEDFSCYGNKLASLDVSGLSSLKTLNCDSNQLASLNVSKLASLEELSCYNNKLASLNVSKLTSLEKLNCDSNELVSLNVSGHASLKTLWCESNRLTSLNVSGCTSLEDLSCKYNRLAVLDLTGLGNLQAFTGGGQTPSLTLTGNGSRYTASVAMSTKTTFDNSAVSYAKGVLSSKSTTATSVGFTAPTGLANKALSGTLALSYKDQKPKPPAAYTVAFDASGGTVKPASVKRAPNEAIGTLPTPKRTGHAFQGWYSPAGNKVKVTSKVTKNVTLTARWKANSYKITFDPKGGKVSTKSVTKVYGSKIGTLPKPTRTGYTFQGWYTAGGTKVAATTKVTKNLALNAQWVRK
jgi:uncharacterized repeat protein (TIGR02543 family)